MWWPTPLSIVLLNVTAARRALESGAHPVDDSDVADALDALRDAEGQGRAAMGDVRRTIELLRDESTPEQAQPGLSDIAALIDGFRRVGSSVTAHVELPAGPLSSATELRCIRWCRSRCRTPPNTHRARRSPSHSARASTRSSWCA